MNPATRMMVEKLRDLADRGMTYQQAADEVGGTLSYVYTFARRYSVPLQAERGRGRPQISEPNARAETMRSRFQAGETLEQIGQSYGITRERVRQIIHKYYGLRAADGGQAEQTREARKDFQRKREARMMKRWGCSYRYYLKILKHPDRPTMAYTRQRNASLQRGICWDLTLFQWWKIWEQSGHWSGRGRGRGYCMCRLNDTGPYAVDNVYIATGIENMLDYWVNRRASESMGSAA